jgi:hypothetical protein
LGRLRLFGMVRLLGGLVAPGVVEQLRG